MWRNVGAVIAGLFVCLIGVALFENINDLLYPRPDDIDTYEEMISNMPNMAFAILVLAHAVGTFCGSIVATMIGQKRSSILAIFVGSIVMLGGVINLIMLDGHPVWFWIADVLVYIPSALLGYELVKKRLAP